jgi:hypothetical protein
VNELDIDAVTDRYLRRYAEPIDRDMGFVWPHDSFHWAMARADIACQRVTHGFRNAGLSMARFGRITYRTAQAMRDFADRLP